MATKKLGEEFPKEFLVISNEIAENFQNSLNEAYANGYKLLKVFPQENLLVAVMQLK